jgi:general secretion pathway protein A
MYQKFFGLEKNPFSITPDPAFLYMTAAHREALAGLLFAITCRKGFLVLTGDAGTGKTTLIRTMLSRVSPTRTIFSFVVHPTLTPAEFLEYTLLDFGLTNIPASKAQRLRLFHEFLVNSCAQGKTPVLVVDEAQKLSPELLEEIRLLTNAETAEQKLLQIILAGQNELSGVLARDDMRQLRQRIAVRVAIGPLSETDVLHYMQTRWVRAGAARAFPFEAEAVQAIAQYSRGIPRVINVISDSALLNAYGTESQTIRLSHITTVARDLQIVLPAATTKELPVSPPRLISTPLPPVSTTHESPEIEQVGVATLDRYMPAIQEKKPMLTRWATRLGLGGA